MLTKYEIEEEVKVKEQENESVECMTKVVDVGTTIVGGITPYINYTDFINDIECRREMYMGLQ